MFCLESSFRSAFESRTLVDHRKHKVVKKRAERVPFVARRSLAINASKDAATTSRASHETADVVVVGTGVLGLSIARELVLRGSKVTLIGAVRAPAAASFAAGAMIDAFGELRDEEEFLGAEQLRLRVDAQRAFKGWLNLLEQDTDTKLFYREGLYIIGNSSGDNDVSNLSCMKAALNDYKEPYELVDPTDIEGLAPNVRYEAHSGMWLPGALSVDTHNLMQSLGRFAERSPMVRWDQHPCRSLKLLSKEWLVELANGNKISTPKLVLCAGAYSQSLLGKHLWQTAGLPNLHFGRGTSVIVGGLPALPYAIRTPNRALACGIHVVPRDNGQWYIGSTNHFDTHLEGATGPTCGELHALLGQTSAELNTSLGNATILQVGWGLRPVTSNGAPVFGSTKLDGLFIACGTHRQGINVAPEVGRMVSEEVLHGTGPTHVFSPNSHQEVNQAGLNLALGVHSIVKHVLHPTAELAYNRQRELEVFLETLLGMALNDDATDSELRGKLKALSENIQMSEQCVLRMFHEVVEKKLRDPAPYVTCMTGSLELSRLQSVASPMR